MSCSRAQWKEQSLYRACFSQGREGSEAQGQNHTIIQQTWCGMFSYILWAKQVIRPRPMSLEWEASFTYRGEWNGKGREGTNNY